MYTKEEVRRRVKESRKKMNEAENIQRSLRIIEQVVKLSEYINSSLIYTYIPLGMEVSTLSLLQHAFYLNKQVCVPKVEGSEINFYQITSLNEVQLGHFGILEPITNNLIKEQAGFMVMPGVAFDIDRNRVGYGKGYYDRYLLKNPQIYPIGIGFDFQIFSAIRHDAYDVKPKRIISETCDYL